MTVQDSSEIIEYAYPDMGLVRVTLQAESAKLFRFVRREGRGTEYFEKLDQLGALRSVHKSAHHSRWEYMVLQMYLIQQLKRASVFGLSTSLRLGRRFNVTSMEELLKSWVLLNNYGHLLDTTEAERVWLESILEEPRLRQCLLDCMPDDRSKECCRYILEQERLYEFHHLITLALLGRAKEKSGTQNKAQLEMWIDMTKALLSDMMDSSRSREGSKLSRALTAFRAIRRVSYVLLDVNHSTLFLRIDANNVLRNVLSDPDAFLYDPDSEANTILKDMEHLLFSQVYASKPASLFKYHYFRGQKKNFSDIVARNGIESFCANHNTFANQLHQAKINNFGKFSIDADVRHLSRLNLLPAFPFERNVCRYHTEQDKLRSKLDERVDLMVTPTPYSESGSILDVFGVAALDVHTLSTTFRALTEYLLESYVDWRFDRDVMSYAMSTPLQELFTFILGAFVGVNFSLRFAAGSSLSDHHVDIVADAESRKRWLKDFSSELRDSGLPADRQWELKALRSVVSRHQGDLLLIAMSNIHLYASDGTRKAEWDGAFFDIGKDRCVLYLIEAKRNVSKRSGSCASALLRSISKAEIRAIDGSYTVIRRTGYACAVIPINEIVPAQS